ncbi:unnamed protein product [Parnassius mnemosyne]|uniref:Uncharacterized protein n=1 Tax=Parnassius mnemosyne TaxID=213953 RepID=A0AAV1M220_9NEOP
MKISTIIFMIVTVIAVRGNDDFRTIDSIRQEAPCSSQGICTIAADCPKGKLVEQSGLCPTQRSQGVECCYGLSVKETRCRKHGGSCVSAEEFCNHKLIYYEASDCGNGFKCCIRV